jgi:hypothetical protein
MSTYGPITVSGTTICLIPLTTAWSAASACQSLFLDNQIQSTGASAFQLFAYDGKYAAVAGGGPTCLPPDVSRWWSQSTNSQTAVVTQLGGYNFHCPEAYTTVFSLDPNIEMTTIGCCPSYVITV